MFQCSCFIFRGSEPVTLLKYKIIQLQLNKIRRLNFSCFLTMHHSIELFHLPTLMHNSLHINNIYSYTTILDMFRALTCPSSGGPIVFSQHLTSSLSVNGCTVHQLRADSALSRFTVQPFTESDVTRCCENIIGPPEDGHVNARNMSRIVVTIHIVND
jgi:hypothetical protein